MNPKTTSKPRIGEVLLQHKLIDSHQLKEALRVQSQKGGQIGSILIELGYVSTETLLDFLGKQMGIPTTNLFQLSIPRNILNLLPFYLITKYRVLPLEAEYNSVTLGMANPNDLSAISEIEFLTGKRVSPVIVSSSQIDLAIKSIQEKRGESFDGSSINEKQEEEEVKGIVKLDAMLKYLTTSEASDMLITAGVSPSIKVHNTLKRSNLPKLTPEQCVQYAKALMSDKQWEEFLRKKQYDFAISYEGIGRFRINVYRQRNSVSISIRHLLDIIPSFEILGLPEWLGEFALKTQGLILITGPASHGKTTTLASMIDMINAKRKCNIVTLEDPIEYLHKHKNSNVNQREIGTDVDSFYDGMKSISRQSPDVIVIGDMRDNETIEMALRAASTGHLVLSNMHSFNATGAIDRIINSFLPHQQPQVLGMITDSLQLVFAQRLLPREDSDERILAYEKLINSYRIKNLIRENKIHQIRSQVQTDSDDFSSIDMSLVKLLNERKICLESG
ncbi:MAG: PilT/PilU family type 4a pilus ATPase, partial [Thermodesulfovibrionales bacterium]